MENEEVRDTKIAIVPDNSFGSRSYMQKKYRRVEDASGQSSRLSRKVTDKKTTSPELFFGLVGATGTDLTQTRIALQDALAAVGYTPHIIKLSKELQLAWNVKTQSEGDRIEKCMDAGDEVRLQYGLPAVAVLGVHAVRKIRSGEEPNKLSAYIFHQLKHPAEVKALRQIYGESFYLISAYSNSEKRRKALETRLADSQLTPKDREEKARSLMQRDLDDAGRNHGQQVRKTFHLADLFVNADNSGETKREIDRFIALIFGDPFKTPYKHEHCMYFAQSAALRSADLGRQVGAAVATKDGDILCVGTNEVPKAGGGQYWADDPEDHRDYTKEVDINERKQRELFEDVLIRLKKGKQLNLSDKQIKELAASVFSNSPPEYMQNAEFLNLIAFYRAVHAETASLLDAARRGVAIKNAIMYVTAFPCHECARHIVAAGIERVIYIEPYPKSLAAEQYQDSIVVDPPSPTHKSKKKQSLPEKVSFTSFVGVAPRIYQKLFTVEKGRRKKPDGSVNEWSADTAKLRYFTDPALYLAQEAVNLKAIDDLFSKDTGGKTNAKETMAKRNSSKGHKKSKR